MPIQAKMNVEQLVTVIIPAFNYGHLLRETVNSARNQSYENLEILVIDDCSTDSTKEVVASLMEIDSRLKYIKQDRNQGVSAARNRGLKLTNGDFVAFLDGDDLWEVNKIEEQIKFLRNKPDVGFTNCGGVLFGSKEEPFSGSHHRHRNVKNLEVDLLYHAAIPCPMSCLIFRREVLDQTGKLDENLHYAEDRDLIFRALQYTCFEALDANLVRIRKHTGNYAHKYYERAIMGNIRFVKKTFRHLSWKHRHHWFLVLGNLYYAASYQYLNQDKRLKSWIYHGKALLYNPLLLFSIKFHVQTLKCLAGRSKGKGLVSAM